MVNVNELLTSIRADVEAKRLKPIDLAREAGLQPTTVYTMLEPEWSNRAVNNVEALAAAYDRITSKTRGRSRRTAAAERA
jgi:hypothetical protein